MPNLSVLINLKRIITIMSAVSNFVKKLTLRKIFLKLDQMILSNKGLKAYSSIRDRKLFRYKNHEIAHGYTVQYRKHDNSKINVLCDKYGSDKGEVSSKDNPYVWPSHNYADIYDLMFRLRRNDVSLVLECGLGTNNPEMYSSMGVNGKPGASLRLWRDYFPNASIIGCDIDERVLFEEERIKTFGCDQTNQASIANFIENAGIAESSADIIIDDGLHEFHAGRSFFEGTIKYLSDDGIYVIEDVNPVCFLAYKDYFLTQTELYQADFFNLSRPGQNIGGNRLVVIRKN